jgi:hypothetical protein
MSQMVTPGPTTISAARPLGAPDRTWRDSPGDVAEVPILLQKSPSWFCEMEFCNNRIRIAGLLNRCCAFVPDLESMFRDEMLKILLQQYLP